MTHSQHQCNSNIQQCIKRRNEEINLRIIYINEEINGNKIIACLSFFYFQLNQYSSQHFHQYVFELQVYIIMSFRDTFTRGSGSENLQYDDTAAYHFCTTMLILIAVPLFYSIIKSILYPFSHIPSLHEIEKKPQFKEKVKKFKKQNKFSYLTCGFVLKLILLIFIVFALVHCISFLRQVGDEVRGFDPYEILQVQTDATIQKIKKSYRKLALKYHPDRNKNDPQASARFIMISKAYQCLTDPQKKQNCEKFGNPEGTSSFNVGIALPSFLVKKENHVTIMAIVFVLVVIILPIFLIYYFSEVNKYDEYGMLQQSHPFIHSTLNQQFSIQDCVRCLSLCQEFKNLRIKSGQGEKLQLLLKQADENMKKVFFKKKFFNHIKKAIILIDARVTEKQVPAELQEDYRFIMKKIPIMVKASVMTGLQRSVESVARMRPQLFVGEGALMSLILFGQRFLQGKSLQAQPFQQLNLNEAEIEKIYKKKKKRKLTSLRDLQQNSQDREFLLNLLTPERQQHVKQYLNYIPQVNVDVIVHIAGHEESISAMDVIQVIVTVKTNRKANFCSSTTYPFLKQQGWYIIASQNNFVLHLEHFIFQDTSYEAKFNLRPHGKQGNYGIDLKIASDCYFGLDIEKRVKYNVGVARKIEVDTKEHEKIDEEAGKSFMERVLGSLKPPEEEQLSDKQD